MMPENILIVEDEKPNADRLVRLLKQFRPSANILSVLDTVKGSVEWLSMNNSPDIIMMDVRLADGLSFEIFNQVEVKCPVIFTTAFDEYAIRAFKYNSIDYLLKPIEIDELEAALLKYASIIQPPQLSPSIESLLNYLQPKECRTRFLLPFRDGYKTFLVDEVALFYSEAKITHAKLLTGETEIVPQTLEELDQQLNQKKFFRANRQYIISIDAIQKVNNYFNGKLKIEIKKNPEVEIIISREKAGVFKSWMDY